MYIHDIKVNKNNDSPLMNAWMDTYTCIPYTLHVGLFMGVGSPNEEHNFLYQYSLSLVWLLSLVWFLSLIALFQYLFKMTIFKCIAISVIWPYSPPQISPGTQYGNSMYSSPPPGYVLPMVAF